jgi:hypothetical protein
MIPYGSKILVLGWRCGRYGRRHYEVVVQNTQSRVLHPNLESTTFFSSPIGVDTTNNDKGVSRRRHTPQLLIVFRQPLLCVEQKKGENRPCVRYLSLFTYIFVFSTYKFLINIRVLILCMFLAVSQDCAALSIVSVDMGHIEVDQLAVKL